MAILTRTKRFKAAVAAAGYYDLFRYYSSLHYVGLQLEHDRFPNIALGVSPWERRELYIENNPLFYLDRVETPVLLVVGDQDAFLGQAEAAFVGLRRLGKNAELAIYVNEGHVIASLRAQADYLRRLIGWFDRYLLSDTTVSGKAKH